MLNLLFLLKYTFVYVVLIITFVRFMRRNILTGIRTTGYMQLGNYIGAFEPYIRFIKENPSYRGYVLLADYHSIASIADPRKLLDYRQHMAAAAMSFCPSSKIFFQSDFHPSSC